jgi:hypothetical protein
MLHRDFPDFEVLKTLEKSRARGSAEKPVLRRDLVPPATETTVG